MAEGGFALDALNIAVSALIGAAASTLTWVQILRSDRQHKSDREAAARAAQLRKHEDELRRGDAFEWANDVVEIMQELYILTSIGESLFGSDNVDKRVSEIAVISSVALEKGRFLFKNDEPTDYGPDKPSSYRGHRPKILDCILIAHLISRHWATSPPEVRVRLKAHASAARRSFISLAQKEVGRAISISPDGAQGGERLSLDYLLNNEP